jgi:hypothetical protein
MEAAAAEPYVKMSDVVNGSVQPTWRFLTSHALTLLCIHRDPDIRMRDLCSEVGITERRAQKIVSELVDADFVTREKVGRRNRYTVRADLRVSHPDWGEHNLGDVLSLAGMWTGLRPKPPEADEADSEGWSPSDAEASSGKRA